MKDRFPNETLDILIFALSLISTGFASLLSLAGSIVEFVRYSGYKSLSLFYDGLLFAGLTILYWLPILLRRFHLISGCIQIFIGSGVIFYSSLTNSSFTNEPLSVIFIFIFSGFAISSGILRLISGFLIKKKSNGTNYT